jgi:cytochrome c-type biogenesis protein CcmE
MKARHKKLYFIIFAVVGLSAATLLVLNAFSNNIVFFYSPTQVFAGEAPVGTTFRLGGLVKQDSVHRTDNSLDIRFAITDKANDIEVFYQGILPDLFREGQGVVVEGKLVDKQLFKAEQVLAKHDENYMPPEAAAALKQAADDGYTYSVK